MAKRSELQLLMDFAKYHGRLKDGKLFVRTTDKFLIDDMRKYIFEQTNLESQIYDLTRTGNYEIRYTFNMYNFDSIIRKLKVNNLGIIKGKNEYINGFVVSKGNFEFDNGASVPTRDVFRMFVLPTENRIRFLTLPEYISYDLKCNSEIDFFDFVSDVKQATDKFNDFINPILDKYKFTVKKERQDKIKEKLSDGKAWRIILDNGEEITFSTSKSLHAIEGICKKIYPNHRSIEPIKFADLDDLVKQYNINVTSKIKELQELKILA